MMLNKLFSRHCTFCSLETKRTIDLCQLCESYLPRLDNQCFQCGLNLVATNTKPQLCGKCLHQPPPYDRMIAAFPYHQAIAKLLSELKFNAKLNHSLIVAKLLLDTVKKNYASVTQLPDCIIPIPLHPQRIKERGFNQAIEIAKPISKALKIKLDYSNCHRIIPTAPQSLTPAKQRKTNIKNAFIVQKPPGRHIAIIDDTVTTGNTVAELSRALRKKKGVEQIDIWCCARTQTNNRNISLDTALTTKIHNTIMAQRYINT